MDRTVLILWLRRCMLTLLLGGSCDFVHAQSWQDPLRVPQWNTRDVFAEPKPWRGNAPLTVVSQPLQQDYDADPPSGPPPASSNTLPSDNDFLPSQDVSSNEASDFSGLEFVPQESLPLQQPLTTTQELIGPPPIQSGPSGYLDTLPSGGQALPPTYLFSEPALRRFGYSSPVRFSVFGGENFAEPDSFVSLELLRPFANQVMADGSETIQYADTRLGYSQEGMIGNFGLGCRHYNAEADAIFGTSVWYDGDTTGEDVFHQISAGAETQFQYFTMRGHYYFPIGPKSTLIEFSDYTGENQFVGNNLLLGRYRIEDQAYQGYEVEGGLILPMGSLSGRILGGYYDFRRDEAMVRGYQSTVVVSSKSGFSTALQANYDLDTEDVGFLVSATYEFYNGPRDPAPTIRHRLGESVRRNRHVLTRRTEVYAPDVALDTAGNPIHIVHVSSLGNSTGDFESPYANLAQAQAEAETVADSIILAHAGSSFTGQSITVPSNVRLLGDGATHTVTTQQVGDATLPRANSNTALPIIANAPVNAVSLSSNASIDGLQINGSGGAAILADGVQNYSVSNVSIDGGNTGLHLRSNSGAATLNNISVANTTGDGLLIEQSGASSTTTIQGTLAINNAGQHGVHLSQNNGAFVTEDTSTLTVTNSGGHGVFMDDNAATSAATFNGDVTVNTTGGSGVFVSNLGTSTATTPEVQFLKTLAISNTTGNGLDINSNGSGVGVTGLAITDWGGSAIVVNSATANVAFNSDLTLNNAGGSLAPTILVSNTTSDVAFRNVTVTDNSRTAIGLPSVSLNQNDTGLNDISFTTLNVTGNNGIGLFAQDFGASVSKLEIGGGVIEVTGSTAVSLEGLSTDVTLQSVSSRNATVGISLRDIGTNNAFHSGFRILGDSSTVGSGGQITGSQIGVVVDGAHNVSLSFLQIDATSKGIEATFNGTNLPENLSVTRNALTDGGGSANWVGMDVNWNDSGHLRDPNQLSSNTITGSGANQLGIRILNNGALAPMDITVENNTINLIGATSDGISVTANGSGVGTIGDVILSGTLNNIVNTTQTPFISTTAGANITGSILVNGVSRP